MEVEQRKFIFLDHFFARARGNRLWENFPTSVSSGKHLQFGRGSLEGDLRSMNMRMRSANSSKELTPRASFHASIGAELIDQDLRAGNGS